MVSVLSKSLQILADLCGSICSCLKLIVVDYWPVCEWIKLPALPSLQKFQTFLANMASGEYFPLICFQGDGVSWQLPMGEVPAHKVAMDTSLHWPEVFRSLPTFKAPGARFSKLPKLFRWHHSLCIFTTKVFRDMIFCSYFNFYSLYIWKDQLYRMSGLQFYEWLFAPETSSGLSRNWAQFPLAQLSAMSLN